MIELLWVEYSCIGNPEKLFTIVGHEDLKIAMGLEKEVEDLFKRSFIIIV